jgi:Na+/melibiose symporter-like transporter
MTLFVKQKTGDETTLSKRTNQIFGIVLILVAIILAIVQHFNVYNFYGDASNKWYFYGLVGIIGIIGIILLAWSYLKK